MTQASVAAPVTDLSWQSRIYRVFLDPEKKSVADQVHVITFFIGIVVEFWLIFLALYGITSVSTAPERVIVIFWVLCLFIGLLVHQSLIFRNFTLHRSHSRTRYLELWVCALFAILTGEVGYIVTSLLTSFGGEVEWLLPYAFSDAKLHSWNLKSLGVILKSVFATGAVVLCASILIWDMFVWREMWRGESLEGADDLDTSDLLIVKSSQKWSILFFVFMDLMSMIIWLALLGVVWPEPLFGLAQSWWLELLQTVSLLYFGVAIVRAIRAMVILNTLADPRTSISLVVL